MVKPAFGAPGYRKWFVLGLMVQVAAAWFSVGYHHPDEHFQVLEFCNNRLGYSPAADLPWEYAAQCRSSILPYIALGVCYALKSVGLYNPFVAAFLLRLAMGVLAWWVTCRMIAVLLPEFDTDGGRRLFVASSFLLWFVPYLGVRFSSENFAGLLFFLVLTILLQLKTNELKKQFAHLAVSGVLLAIALFIRLQIGFAFIGLAVWLFFARKLPWRSLFALVLFAIPGAVLAIVLDRLFYGSWVLTPFNYFDINILQHRAASWGSTPWWDYFWMFFQMAIPPLSIVLLFLFLVGIVKRPMHLLSLVCISMIAGHIFIGHKEMRFLFLLSPAFIFLFCRGADLILARYTTSKWHEILFAALATLNACLLAVKMLTPAHESVKYYSYIYQWSNKHKTTLMSFGRPPYNMEGASGIEMNFYKPRNLDVRVLADSDELRDAAIGRGDGSYILLSKQIIRPNNIGGHPIELLYCVFPDWLLHFNIFDWQGRSNIWAIYKVYPRPNYVTQR
jgi:phosphatidylinositol glycan class B